MTNDDVVRILGNEAVAADGEVMRLAYNSDELTVDQIEARLRAIIRKSGSEPSEYVPTLAQRIADGYRGAELYAF